jgi:hypothetical protein
VRTQARRAHQSLEVDLEVDLEIDVDHAAN